MKYVIYLRVSTDQQVQSGFGIEGQRTVCLSYISRNHLGMPQSVLEFVDEGMSGALELDRRPALFAAVKSLEKDDVLLIAKRDRIGRDPIVNAMIERAVERKKARIVSASGDVRDNNDPSTVLMKRMIDAFSEYERLIIGERTKTALAEKRRKGQRMGYIPYGYRLCTDNVHIEKDEKEQEILSMICSARNEGISFRDICRDLNEMGIPNRFGRSWTHVSVFRVAK